MRGPGFNPRHLHFFSFFFFFFNPVVGTTRLHYSYTSALDLRTFFVVTKSDACYKEGLEKTIKDLKDLILNNRGVPFVVGDEQHVVKSAEFLADNR